MEDKSDGQLSTKNQDLAFFTLGGEARRPIKVDVKIRRQTFNDGN